MNIQHTIPEIESELQGEEFRNTQDLWRDMIRKRLLTFRGFAAIEEKKGFVRPSIPLSSPNGQEVIRLLLFRFLEEAVESYESNTPEHRKEEVIDALNYLLAIPLMDSDLFDPNRLVLECWETSSGIELVGFGMDMPITIQDLGEFTLQVGGSLADTLRNRSWMNNSQDLYFSGTKEYYAALRWILGRCIRVFTSFHEFVLYFYAKDAVLQFRLKSNY